VGDGFGTHMGQMGRSITRWSDASKKYGLSEQLPTETFDKKVKMVVRMKSCWGHYVTISDNKNGILTLSSPNVW
jgi:hypothetical protein